MPGRRVIHAVALGALALGLTGYAFGGWAVITVDDFPDVVTAGEPVNLSFVVRQHGITLLSSLSPTVTANDGKVDVTARVTGGSAGHYSTQLILPKPGKWSITVNSGFGASKVKLPVVHALGAGTAMPAGTPSERGRRLFVAKGCVTCHVHGAVADMGNTSLEVGPELTPKRYEAAYLRRFLVNPSITRTPGRPEMPALGLSNAELTALVAFINADHSVAAQR
jgi:mono/diheme cytochrome c family protein